MRGLVTPKFPSVLDADRGKRSWIKKYVRACWDDFTTINTNSFYNGRVRYNNIKKYMLGEQPMDQYIKRLDGEVAGTDKSWLKTVNKPLPIVTKYARMTKSTLKKSDYNVLLTSIDVQSREEKNEYYIKNASLIKLRQIAEKQGVTPDLFDEPDRGFKEIEELDVFMQHGYKSRFEVEGEEAIKLILNNCSHGLIRNKNIEQLHDYGFVGYKDYFDKNGDVREEFVDVRDFIVSRCKFEDFSDATYMGQVKDVSIADLFEMDLDNELSEQDKIKLVQRSTNNYNDYQILQHLAPEQYENERVLVLDVEFKSIDSYVLEEGVNKRGNTVVSRKKSTSKVNKLNTFVEAEYTVIYEGKWVIGTDIYFGCKRQTNMKRPRQNLSDVKFSYSCFAPQLNNMETSSMAEIYIPISDTLQMAWLKYQHVINTAKVRGLLIDLTSLENVSLGKGGATLTPLDNLAFYEKKGTLFYRSIDEEGKNVNKPITELPNGLGEEAGRFFNEIQNQISLMQQLSGYNELTDGSTPDARTLNGVAKQASESTNNSIEFMKSAERACFESLCYGILLRIQDAAEMGRLKNYVNAIGMESVKFFEVSPEISARELGINVQDKPTEFEKEVFNKSVEIALANQQITIADAFIVRNIENVKHAEAVLALRVRQNIDLQQKIQAENIDRQAKVQQDSANATSQLKQQEVMVETEAKKGLIMAELEKEKELYHIKYEYELKMKEMEVTGRIQQNKDQANAKIYSADRDAKTKESMNERNIEKENLHKAAEIESKQMEMAEADD